MARKMSFFGTAKVLFKLMTNRKYRRSMFQAAASGRLVSDWLTTSKSIDDEVYGSLSTMRARSRDAAYNNDHGRKFLNLLKTHVVGPTGIKIKPRPVDYNNGTEVLDTIAADKIRQAWNGWCHKKQCTVTGQLSFLDVLNLVITSVARDGEIFVRKYRGFDNDFKFALQLIEADMLDEKLKDKARRIQMGVQKDSYDRPIAYHFLANPPSDFEGGGLTEPHEILAAKKIIHPYVIERVGQSRGIPWMISALKRLHMLNGYEESELVAARVGAAKMGFLEDQEALGYAGDDSDADGNTTMEVTPGTIERLPRGVKFSSFDVDHPSTAFDSFVKAVLRAAASGLNVQYYSLSGDLSGANYSSLRQGALEERDVYTTLQGWLIRNFVEDVYTDWLEMALMTGQLNLPVAKMQKWQRVMWQGRRWMWVDPQKEITAAEKSVSLGIKSRTRISNEQGLDIEETFEDLANEQKLANSMGLNISGGKTDGGQNSQEDEDENALQNSSD